MTTRTPTVEQAEELLSARPANLWRDTLRNILSQRSAQVGLVLLGIVVAMALFAPLIAPYDPIKSVLDLGETRATGAVRNAPPCIHLLGCSADQAQHILGLDSNLRDEFSRVIFGSQISLRVGFLTVGLAIIVGTILGAIAGFAGGWTDNIIMRLMDVLLAFPALVLAIAIVVVLGPGLINAQYAIAIVAIPGVRACHAGIGSFDQGARLRDGVARAGRIVDWDPVAADPAQCPDAAHRAGHAGHRRCHP